MPAVLNLKLKEIFIYYDEPLLVEFELDFSCDHWMALKISQENETEKAQWLLMVLDKDDYLRLTACNNFDQAISLKTALERSRDIFIYKSNEIADKDLTVSAEKILLKDIPEKNRPNPGSYLSSKHYELWKEKKKTLNLINRFNLLETRVLQDCKLSKELLSYDFEVEIHHGDGSRFVFKNAFAVQSREALLIFTEHCGCSLFIKEDLAEFSIKKKDS